MLELLFLRWFCTNLAATARGKNRSGAWGALGALFWFGGEISGAIIAAGNSGADTATIYMLALVGAVVGAVISYVIVKALPEIPLDRDFPVARVV
jgi:hypothetical protein